MSDISRGSLAESPARLDEAKMRGALLISGQAACGDFVSRKGLILLGEAFLQLAEDHQRLKRRFDLPQTLSSQ